MAEKEEKPKYIGRYGEVLEITKECRASWLGDTHKYVEGKGIDKDGNPATVVFTVSLKTGKIDGKYGIERETSKECDGEDASIYEFYCESSYFKDGVLHGEEEGCYQGVHRGVVVRSPWKEVFNRTWVRGRSIEGKKEDIVRAAKTTRQLLSDSSVLAAIRTGDPLKVKSAMTRAITGTPRRRKANENG